MSRPEIARVVASDGASSELRVFGADQNEDVAVCMPAMGVSASYYDPFGAALAERGVTAVLAEHRGTGSSSVVPRRGVDFGYVHMLTEDYPAVVDAARQRLPRARLHLVGHSLGGQLGALYMALSPETFTSLSLVASSSVDYRCFEPSARARVLFGTQLARVVAEALGYFPGHRLGFGGLQPRGVIADWSRQSRTGRYEPDGAPIDFERALGQVRRPVLAISIEGDELAAPPSVDGLVRKLEHADVERVHARISAGGPKAKSPHFRWARKPAPIADRVAAFIRGAAGRPRAAGGFAPSA